MVISLHAERFIDKIQHPFMMKFLGEIRDSGVCVTNLKEKLSWP